LLSPAAGERLGKPCRSLYSALQKVALLQALPYLFRTYLLHQKGPLKSKALFDLCSQAARVQKGIPKAHFKD
jgi:hypothetical protein